MAHLPRSRTLWRPLLALAWPVILIAGCEATPPRLVEALDATPRRLPAQPDALPGRLDAQPSEAPPSETPPTDARPDAAESLTGPEAPPPAHPEDGRPGALPRLRPHSAPDADVPPLVDRCTRYCEAAESTCPWLYRDAAACEALCTVLDTAPGLDPLVCRLRALDRARQSPVEQAAACAAAGPGGGDHCEPPCTAYCRLMNAACPGAFPDDAACLAACRQWPQGEGPPDLQRDTVWCRIHAAAEAAMGDEAACAEARLGGQRCLPGAVCARGLRCPEGTHCVFPTGRCDAMGTCQARPEACPGPAPVCGCDGLTYPDACAAFDAGVAVDRAGPCVEIPCRGPRDCPFGGWCARPAGQCQAVGFCRPTPPIETACEGHQPMCGCDGRAYAHACAAARRGISVAGDVPCPPRACLTASDCGYGLWCARPEGQCGGQGQCTPRPEICPEPEGAPVCGCDGLTWPSACAAARAGVGLSGPGPCPPRPCGRGPAPCPSGSHCVGAAGVCRGERVCLPRPASCPEIDAPICGCDGRTWPGTCAALRAGITVYHPGPCGRACQDHIDCGPDGLCLCPPGAEGPDCPTTCQPCTGLEPLCPGDAPVSACSARDEGVARALIDAGRCVAECAISADCADPCTCCLGGRCQPCMGAAGCAP